VNRLVHVEADRSGHRGQFAARDGHGPRAALERERARRLAVLSALNHLNAEGGVGPTDPRDELAGADDVRTLRVTVIGENQHALAEIASAMARVEAGTYGTCEHCKRPIDRERLDVRPEVRLCVTCHLSMQSHPGCLPARPANLRARRTGAARETPAAGGRRTG
jgi:DnaK suppressor protein